MAGVVPNMVWQVDTGGFSAIPLQGNLTVSGTQTRSHALMPPFNGIVVKCAMRYSP